MGACRRLVQQPPQRALAQRDVATFPRPLEARQSGMLRVWSCFCARRSRTVSPSMCSSPLRWQQRVKDRTVARCRFHVAGAASGQRCASTPPIAAPVTGAVAKTSSTASVWRYFARVVTARSGCDTKRVDRRRKSTVSLAGSTIAQGGAAAGGHRHRRRFYSAGRRGASGRQRRLRRKRSSSRTASLARLRSCAPRALTIDGARTRDFAGNGPFPAQLRTLQRWAAVGPLDLGRRVFSSRAAVARSRGRRRVAACAWSFSRLCRSRSPPGSPQVDQR